MNKQINNNTWKTLYVGRKVLKHFDYYYYYGYSRWIYSVYHTKLIKQINTILVFRRWKNNSNLMKEHNLQYTYKILNATLYSLLCCGMRSTFYSFRIHFSSFLMFFKRQDSRKRMLCFLNHTQCSRTYSEVLIQNAIDWYNYWWWKINLY